MANPVFDGTESSGFVVASIHGNTLTIGIPSNVVDDDLMVAVLSTSSSSGFSLPTNWTDTGFSTASPNLQVYWKKAASEGTNQDFTASFNQNHHGCIFRVTGADTTTPMAGQADGSDFNSPITCPTITPSASNTLLIRAYDQTGRADAADTGGPASHTLVFARLGSGLGLGVAFRDWTSGATGTADFSTGTNASAKSMTFAIQQAAAAGGIPAGTLGLMGVGI